MTATCTAPPRGPTSRPKMMRSSAACSAGRLSGCWRPPCWEGPPGGSSGLRRRSWSRNRPRSHQPSDAGPRRSNSPPSPSAIRPLPRASPGCMKTARVVKSCSRSRWGAAARFLITTTTGVPTFCWSIPAPGPPSRRAPAAPPPPCTATRAIGSSPTSPPRPASMWNCMDRGSPWATSITMAGAMFT